MSLKDRFYIIKKRLFEKRNILLIFVLILLLIIIYACITVIYFSGNFLKISEKNNPGYRELWVAKEEENYDALKNIEHIDYYVNTKFSKSVYQDLPEFDSNTTKGEIEIKALIDLNDITIVDGTNVIHDYELVCPQNFYPYSENKNTNKTKVYYDKFLDGSLYIGEIIRVTPSIFSDFEEEKDPIDFKIVGVYEVKENFGTLQTCFTNQNSFDKIHTDIAVVNVSTTNGVETITKEYYKGVIVRVDKYENIEKVKTELKKLGYTVSNMFEVDMLALEIFVYVPLFIALILLLIVMNIIYSFLNKKMKYRKTNIGLLKVCGYTDQNILKSSQLENVIILYISVILSFLLYSVIFHILTKYVLYDLVYNNYFIKMPFLYLFLTFVILTIMIMIANKYMTNKMLKQNIKELLEEK